MLVVGGFKTAALFGGSIIVIMVILVLGGVGTHPILSTSPVTSNTRVAGWRKRGILGYIFSTEYQD